MKMKLLLILSLLLLAGGAFAVMAGNRGSRIPAAGSPPPAPVAAVNHKDADMNIDSQLTDEQLAEARQRLSPEQYNVCFLRGTEPPGSGAYEKLFDPGMYRCAVCGAELFSSDTKYDSHSGWPAFWDTLDKSKLTLLTDYDLGYARTEVRCAKCGAHLGHVFDDGPQPSGQRYCINSVALEFVPDAQDAAASEPAPAK
jgi:peptide-methionine (R)-S-oxide reductase